MVELDHAELEKKKLIMQHAITLRDYGLPRCQIKLWKYSSGDMVTDFFFCVRRPKKPLNQNSLVSLQQDERWSVRTSLTAFWAASRPVNVTKAYPRLVPVIGSIISRRSHIAPHFSNNGISSSSNMSLGILPQNTSHPMPGVPAFQFGGGPPYLRWPKVLRRENDWVRRTPKTHNHFRTYRWSHPVCIPFAPGSAWFYPRPAPWPGRLASVWPHPAEWPCSSGDTSSWRRTGRPIYLKHAPDSIRGIGWARLRHRQRQTPSERPAHARPARREPVCPFCKCHRVCQPPGVNGYIVSFNNYVLERNHIGLTWSNLTRRSRPYSSSFG